MRAALLISAALAAFTACSSETPAAQLPPDGGAGDGAAPGTDAAPGADGSAGGTDGAPGADGSTMMGADGGPAGDARPDTGVLDQCNPVTQDCPNMADKCRIEPDFMGQGTQCVPRGADEATLGEVCSGGACEAGLACVNTGTVARCARACDRVTGAPCSTLGADFDCRIQIRGTNWGVCDRLPPLCDPITLAPCDMAQACQPTRRFDGSFEFRCRTAGTGAEGQRCENAGCQRGLVCVREEMVALCRKPCQQGGAACPGMQMCNGTVLGVHYCL